MGYVNTKGKSGYFLRHLPPHGWLNCVSYYFQRYISRDVNPIIRQWMVTITIRELHRILPSVQVSQAELDPYIQRPGAMETSPQSQSSEGSFMSAESVEAPDTMSVESTATLAASQAASHKETEVSVFFKPNYH